jgi:DNA-binding response OmpR family regulator
VLVVDDESAIRMLCRVNLARAGIEVLEAAGGEEALDLARAQRPDLVLLDVMMPGLDGWTVAAELAARPETQEIPVVFLTARAESADRRRGHDLGGVGYVVKPFDPIVLAEVVEGVLERLERGEREALRSELLRPEE